jgi:hypothetical protein
MGNYNLVISITIRCGIIPESKRRRISPTPEVFDLMAGLKGLLTPVTLGTAALFFALLTLRNKLHLLAVGFGDSFSNNNLIESAQ